MGRRPGRDDPPRRCGEAGYTLVMFIVVVTIMVIGLSVAVQTVSFQMRREKEAELIFRGNQYVEAIRLYRAKYGRLPNSLDEIWKAKPRVIRKKFKDPITDSEQWGIVFLGQVGDAVAGGGAPGQQPGQPPPTPTPGFGRGDSQPAQTGPIVGVHSTSCEDSIKILDGRTRYCDWKFVIEEVRQGGPGGAGGNPWGEGGSGGPRPPLPGNRPPRTPRSGN